MRASIAAVSDKVFGISTSDELGVDRAFLEGFEVVVRHVEVD